MIRTIRCICSGFLLWGTAAFAELPPVAYTWQQFDNRSGLSNSAVNYVYQDSDDLLWIGTWDGLNRYDGKTFHVFNYNDFNRNDQGSIGSNVIQHITEDRKKQIWISTIEGISRYDKLQGSFRHYFYSRGKRNRIREQEFEIAVDTAGTVFARSIHGLARYDSRTDSFYRCMLPGVHEQVSKILFDAENRLWIISSKGGLFAFIHKQQHFVQVYASSLSDGAISGLFFVNQELLYSTANGDLYRMDQTTLRPYKLVHLAHAIKAMAYYDDHYYGAFAGQGYALLDRHFIAETPKGAIKALENMKIMAWVTGSEQLLWAATDGNGLIRITPQAIPFASLSPTPGLNKPIRAINAIDGALWVGTKGSGIARLRNFSNATLRPPVWEYLTNDGQLGNNSVFAIRQGSHDFVYIGTDGKGLSFYDRRGQRFLNWADLPGHEQFPEFGSVYAILEDPDGTIWLGTSGYGLIHLRLDHSSAGKPRVVFIQQYTYRGDGKGLANDIIYALCPGKDDELWVACRYGGLSLLHRSSGRIRTFKAFTYEGSLSNNDVLSLYSDHKKRLWIGTSYGLNWISEQELDHAHPIFKKLNSSNGLPNNTIHAITEDDQGAIWVSTNKGLARINPDDLSIAHYQEIDGLQSNEFSDGSVWKDSLGYLYFGGIYGLNYFLPQNIREDTRQPKLLLGGLQLGGKSMRGDSYLVLRIDQPAVHRYSIGRSENFVELELTALSFLRAEKCEYAWLLQGHDNDWHYGGIDGKIAYSNLSPGDYTLLVKWSNGEGVWTGPQEAFSLQVHPYIWLSWPAWLCYLLLLAAGAFYFYKNRKNKLEIKHRLRLEQMLREKDEAVHQEQLNFFTNIAHELQTPLTLIMGSAERFQQRDDITSANRPALLSLLYQQASRLTYLVQQLLEFRKAEAGYLPLQLSDLNISSLISGLTELFVALSEQMDMTFERNIPDGIVLSADRDKLEKVLFNLLSNAFKHAGRGEHIMVSLQYDEPLQYVRIRISNSGCELLQSDLDQLFEKFQTGRQTPGNHFSTGIGLSFAKQLVRLMGGRIHVSLDEGWITFGVDLPVTTPYQQANLRRAPETSLPGSSFLYQQMTVMALPGTDHSSDEQNKHALLETLTQAHKKIILLVEDEPGIRYLLRDLLQEHYILYEAGDGMEAIGLIKKQLPDLIISDVMMPRMDGLTLCHKIKNTPSTCHIPFILLSAKGSVEQRSEGYETGADAYIAKPFQGSHLKVRIKNLFDQQQRLHQLFKQTDPESVSPADQEQQEFLASVIRVIEGHLDNPELNAATLEQALSLSKMQLYRKLKTLSSMSPAEFIRHVRLNHAARLLTSTQLTVAEIFYRTGFNNQSYFFREFKKQYSCAPTEYRSRHFVQA